MAFEPVFESINYNRKRQELTERVKVDSKTDILVENVSSLLNVTAWVTMNDCSVEDGKVGYGGKIIFYVSYVDQTGALKKAECGTEFVGAMKDAGVIVGCRAYATANVEKTETDASGIKLCLTAIVTVKAEISGFEEVKALSGGENLVVDTREVSYTKSLGVRQGVYPIEEEFELSYPVAEVLSHRAEAFVTAAQCGVGCIIVDGEVILSAIMLQKNEKSDIIRENKSVPFRMEIECEEAMPSMSATARVKEKTFKTDVAVDEENGRSVVTLSVVLKFDGEAFSSSEITVAADAFSTEQEVELIKEDVAYYKACDLRRLTAGVIGRSNVDELPVGAVLLAVGGERAEVTEKECGEKGLKITGVITATGYFREGDGRPFTRKLETPFEVLLDCVFDCSIELDVIVKAENARAKIISLTEAELTAELIFTVYPSEKCDIKLVKDIKAVGEKKKNCSAISVYIPLEGEELWSLAKRLNVCPSVLVETNKDLCFPLTGKERIVIYRQR